MKTRLAFICSSFLLFTCSSKSDKQSISPKMIQGVWVPSSYINKIKESKSPLVASDSLSRISALIINSSEFQGDSLYAGVSWGNHVGGNITIFNKRGQTEYSFKTSMIDYGAKANFYEIEYSIQQNDTTLYIIHYDKDKKLIERTSYFKVLNHQTSNDLAYGIQLIVNKTLFSGTYDLIDTEGLRKVVFTNEGRLINWPVFETYYVFTDFAAPGPEGEPSDAICFDIEKRDNACYSFKFNSDTLIIYREGVQTDSTAIPSIKYQLVKTK